MVLADGSLATLALWLIARALRALYGSLRSIASGENMRILCHKL